MDKKVLNIVITGGPCGGKTTSLDELAKMLRSDGYTVYICPEAATELINAGIKPFGDYKLSLRDFQEMVLDKQLSNESFVRKAVSMCSNQKIAILYDRGLLDNRAYIDHATFNEFLIKRNMSETDILTRYDIVIHLVTAAKGQEEYYTLLNNTARTETKEEACQSDDKTIEAWIPFYNHKIVYNKVDDRPILFDEKILMVKNIIRSFLGESEILKQERYFVDIKDVDISKLKGQVVKEDINEFVVNYDNNEIELFSEIKINGSSYYTCIKMNKKTNVKTCRTISLKEYQDYHNRIKGNVIHKACYNFIDNNERFKLNIFDLDNEQMVILERDVVDINRKELPVFIKKAINITDNRDFDDDSIYIDYNISRIYSKKK